jgi:hypothetical protein
MVGEIVKSAGVPASGSGVLHFVQWSALGGFSAWHNGHCMGWRRTDKPEYPNYESCPDKFKQWFEI